MASLLYFLRHYARTYLGLLAAVIAAALADAVAVAALYPLLSVVLDAGNATSSGRVLVGMRAAIDRLPPEHRLAGVLAVYLAALAANTGLQLLREWRMSTTSGFIAYDVKRRLFRRFVDAPYGYFLAARQGDLTYRLSTAPTNLAFALYLTSASVNAAFTVVFLTAVLVSIEWRFTLALAVLGAGVFLANRAVARNVSAWTGRGKQAAASAELDVIQEFVGGVKEIGVAGVGPVWAHRFSDQGERFRQLYVRDLLWAAVPSLGSELVIFGLVGVVLVLARSSGLGAVHELLPVGAVFYYGVRQLLSTSSALGRQALRVAGLLPDVELLHRSLEEPYPLVHEGHRQRVPEWTALEFDGVSLQYPAREIAALHGVSFRIDRGRTLAIVGASGAGKTTIVNLLLRLFDPTDGRILVDGEPLAELTRSAWLDTIGYVSQENFVFNASVADNIRFGRDYSRADVEAAARAAFADEFIAALPLGYDTVVGTHGMTLSGGQRQRLAIARALVRKPRLLVLDEATSSLDSTSEALIQQALTALRGRCTQVVVAHRLSTIRDADRIIVMQDGRVVESGTHHTLLAADGVYAVLSRRQQVESRAPAAIDGVRA
jgi:ABC-type multidrug transport system fused ATPase/permease subunit